MHLLQFQIYLAISAPSTLPRPVHKRACFKLLNFECQNFDILQNILGDNKILKFKVFLS